MSNTVHGRFAFPDQFTVREPLASAFSGNLHEPATVAKRIFAFVVAECLFVQVAVQMPRFNESVGTFSVRLSKLTPVPSVWEGWDVSCWPTSADLRGAPESSAN